tara:strand:+ start:1425 stop:1679 length:255 start_codon:yes stop_codon:yes gene_type:complete
MNAQRFLDLAQRGKSPCASTGERACYKLAKALAEVGDDMMILDSGAIGGFYEVALLMAGPFRTEDDKERVYNLLKPFAGKRKGG